MRKRDGIFVIILLALLLASCEKLVEYGEGRYLCENGELTYLENYGGVYIHWSDEITAEQQEVIREMVMNMVRVEGGSFVMGRQNNNPNENNYDALAESDESPVHNVTLSPYYIGKYEVTQKDWKVIMGSDKGWATSYGLGDSYPAYNIRYVDVEAFLIRINQLSGLTFRLPTEAEWEFAAQGGPNMANFPYSGSTTLQLVAWYKDNSDNRAHPIGTKQPNSLGLYDMSGNVCEWCSDYYGSYSSNNQTNPTGVAVGTEHVLRGGSYCLLDLHCRCAARDHFYTNGQSVGVGFRVVISN